MHIWVDVKNKTEEIINKINEIIDHLNVVHRNDQFHVSLANFDCKGISMETVVNEDKNESKEA